MRYFGREPVLYRTAGGVACLHDAHCPHMGAHLGHGGTVEGGLLRCPFHGFCFDREGACASTAYGTKPPPAARLGTWRVQEKHGFVLAWYHPRGAAPTWEVPDVDTDGWSGLISTRWELRSHPQETSENSVDFGHFTQVHAFTRAEITRPVETKGPLLTTSYQVVRSLDVVGLPGVRVDVNFDVYVHGLGYSLVDGAVPRLGMLMRQFVLSTPVDAQTVHLRIGTRSGRVPVPGLTRLMAWVLYRGLSVEVGQDFAIWKNKRYVKRPALAAGDGPIATYRRWCRQFYDEPAVEQRSVVG